MRFETAAGRPRALVLAIALQMGLVASWLAAIGALDLPEGGARSGLVVPLAILQLPGWLVATAFRLAFGANETAFAALMGVANLPAVYATIRLADARRRRSSAVAARLSQPFPNAAPVLLLAVLVPMYMAIAMFTPGRTLFVPELALDRAVPLQPAWMLVYGSQWIFSFLPVFVVRGVELRRRTVLAYLTIVLVAYAGFLAYPTLAPRPPVVPGDGFFAWGLRFVYDTDPPYNCFPSLHVAYSFLAALTSHRVHRGLGIAALSWATLVGISTLYTKQHYVVDVVAGIIIAVAAWAIFLRPFSRDRIAEADRQRALMRALIPVAIFAVVVAGFWMAYRAGGAG